MRKTLIVITMGLMLTQTVTAQVFDDEKYLQWRSMETGPLGFAPKEYYWLFHNSYAVMIQYSFRAFESLPLTRCSALSTAFSVIPRAEAADR